MKVLGFSSRILKRLILMLAVLFFIVFVKGRVLVVLFMHFPSRLPLAFYYNYFMWSKMHRSRWFKSPFLFFSSFFSLFLSISLRLSSSCFYFILFPYGYLLVWSHLLKRLCFFHWIISCRWQFYLGIFMWVHLCIFKYCSIDLFLFLC